jgi:hypothetical protein
MHKNVIKVINIIKHNKSAANIIFGTKSKVLECGSLDVNGSIREFFKKVNEYIGIDHVDGPGVDFVSLCHRYYDKPDGYFSAVVSTEMLEHDPYWKKSIKRMVELLGKNGCLLLTCASPIRAEHHLDFSPKENYYEGLTVEDLLSTVNRCSSFKTIVGVWNREDTYLLAIHKVQND